MELTAQYPDIIHHDEKLGLITQNELIIYVNNKEEKIDFISVNKVQLVKKRVFYLNLVMLFCSLFIFYLTYQFYSSHSIIASIFFIFGFSIFLYSFYHKYYNYTIVIKEKNKKIHQLKGSHIDREAIKKFYFKILKRANKKRKI